MKAKMQGEIITENLYFIIKLSHHHIS